MYGMPQPNAYGQYGFPGYPGFPGQAAGAQGPGAASPGMPQATPAAGLGLAGAQPGADPNAPVVGQPGQAQWGGADPSSYYSNYWGGQSTVVHSVFDKCLKTLPRLLRSAGCRSTGR
jgi:nucleolysin TIA-1/TIAR